MGIIKIFEIVSDVKDITIAGISEEDVKEYILEKEDDFSAVLQSKDFRIDCSFEMYGMEVSFLNNDIEILHTADKINLIQEDDSELNKYNIPYTYEIDKILVEKNYKNEKTIFIESFDELFD